MEEFHAAIPSLQEHEIVVGFAKIIALFEYGHTRMSLSSGPATIRKLPLQLYHFDEGVYLTGGHKDHGDIVGAKLLKIEGTPIEKVLEEVYPVVPVENDQYFKAYGINYALIPEVLHAQGVTNTLQSEIELTLEKDGQSLTKTVLATSALDFPLRYGEVKSGSDWVSARDLSNDPYFLRNLEKNFYFEFLEGKKALYIRYSQVWDYDTETTTTFFNRVFDFLNANEVDRMILDVRLNGGGNNYKNKQVITGIIENKHINQDGKLYVIIGRRTFSACQNLVNELENYTNAIFLGEATAENINFYGDNKKVTLPKSKLPVYLSFAWWQDKPQWEDGPYTSPDVPVKLTFEDYRTNQDPVLEKALTFNGTNFIKDPRSYLQGLFIEGKMELLQSEAKRMVADPLYASFPFEQEFNMAGFRLLDADQVQEAIYVFQLTANLFPNSAYAWYSLGEAYARAGNVNKAKEIYAKTITLDPEGTTGGYAKEKLEKLKKTKD